MAHNQLSASDAVIYIIEHNMFMTIATADESGLPWSSPVGFVYDENYNMYWVSARNARHSRNILIRPNIAITIYGKLVTGKLEGVYIAATAEQLSDPIGIVKAINLFQTNRPQPDKFTVSSAKDVTGEAIWRMYKASPIEISKRSDAIVDGQSVTVREIVSLGQDNND